ncbi:hypothetical protein ANO14919_051040 [Xylariales sp. No.14919]|nr:hypothetical protein ANO14919_051040 [Xylariales sp. No.14919]
MTSPNFHHAHAVSSANPSQQNISSTPYDCACGSETLRIASLCSHSPGQLYTPSTSSSSLLTAATPETSTPNLMPQASLPATLKLAHSLVQHWGDLNGCPNAELHMSSGVLCSLIDAIGLVLRDHEIAVDSITRRRPEQSLQYPQVHDQSAKPRVSIGRLELEPLERIIVIQESVKHSIIRLTTMLQDIEEEAALTGRDEAESPLRDRAIKGLVTRLFRLLGIVNQMAPTH